MDMTANIFNLDNTLYGMRNAPKADMSEKNRAKAEETAENFEAFFITKMMESMFEGVSTDGMFGGGHAEKIYRSMLLDEYGKAMAKTGSIGIKDDIMAAILQMQEAENFAGLEG